MFSYGKNSKKKLSKAHIDLQKIMNLVIKVTKVDIGISDVYRTKERQYRYFIKGKSTVDGYIKVGKHNIIPAEAVDVFIYHPDLDTRIKLAYDKKHLTYIAGVIDACAYFLYESGEIKHLIRWGANWDSDGIIDYDQKFDDFPHHELIKP